jgi:hypothetical protein
VRDGGGDAFVPGAATAFYWEVLVVCSPNFRRGRSDMKLRIVLEVNFEDYEEMVKGVERATREALVIARREKAFANPELVATGTFNHRNSKTHIATRKILEYERDGRSLSFFRIRKQENE